MARRAARGKGQAEGTRMSPSRGHIACMTSPAPRESPHADVTQRAAATPRTLGRNVVTLGIVSLFTDASSEMIYPLLPIFLTATLGASAAAVGAIEGAAETTAALLKLASGW